MIEPRKLVQVETVVQLKPAVRLVAEAYSEKEGLSLNQFVDIAVEEKLDYLKHQEWVRTRKEPNPELAARALALLDLAGDEPPKPGDEVPAGYR